MRQFNQNVMLLQFGVFLSVGLLTMVTLNLTVSGDSTIPRNNNTLPQSMQTK